MADVPKTNDQTPAPGATNDPGRGAFTEGHEIARPPAGNDMVVAAAAVPEVTINMNDGPPGTGTWNNPRRFDDPAEMERYFQQLSGRHQRSDGSTGPITVVKPIVEYEGRIVTQADVDAGLRVVSSENPAGQVPGVGDLVIWKLDAQGNRDGMPWTPKADQLNMPGDNKPGARYDFTRQDGERMIFSSRQVPTDMVPLNERVSLKLSWGNSEGGPGALLVRYGPNDLNLITNYDLVRLYERGTDPASQAVYDQVKAKVDGAFNSLRQAGGEQVKDESGRQVWNFGQNNSLDQVSRTAADAAANLGIDLKVGIDGVFATIKPGMTAEEFQAEYAKAKAAIEEFKRTSEVTRENGRDVYKFPESIDVSRASEIATRAATALNQEIRVQVGNNEITVKPDMTPNEFKAVHAAADATRRATSEYFPESGIRDASVRERLQSYYLRSNLQTIAQQYDVPQERLLALMDPAQKDLIRLTQPDLNRTVAPLNAEEQTLVDRALLDRFYQRGEEWRANRTGEPPPGFKPATPGGQIEDPTLPAELTAARERAQTPAEIKALEDLEKAQRSWTAEERGKVARYLKTGTALGISVAIVVGGALALIAHLRSQGRTPAPPVVFGPN